MKVTMVSNFFNHHQLPVASEFYRLLGDDFWFVATEKLPQERATLGYHDMNEKYAYCKCAYQSETLWKQCEERVFESDIVIFAYGSAPSVLIKRRLRAKKPTFFYMERIFKKVPIEKVSLRRKLAIKYYHRSNQRKPVYLLCASAFTALDFAQLGLYRNKCLKWGYFPETIYEFPKKAQDGKTRLLWVGRFLDWKHPELAVQTVKTLLQRGYKQIHLDMIGTGELIEEIQRRVAEEGLEDFVTVCGSMSPEEVRARMQHAHIFLMTSDRNEGWGAVLNEAMNSGCVAVVDHMVGAAPYLAKQKQNALIYCDGKENAVADAVQWLLEHPNEMEALSKNAYDTIVDEWNAHVAVERLIQTAEKAQKANIQPIFSQGPMSSAEVLSEDYFA
jgi:glycosyltransferase involved in cell wall biosynthesis